jgi:periplasmic protein CpxP/Spy
MKVFRTLVAITLMMVGTTAMAQGPGQGKHQMKSASERANSETETLTTTLELTSEQKAQVLQINLVYAAKDSVRFAAMRNKQSAQTDRETIMKEMQAERTAQTTEIKALLTEDQQTKYDAYLKERAQHGPGQGGQRPQGDGQE